MSSSSSGFSLSNLCILTAELSICESSSISFLEILPPRIYVIKAFLFLSSEADIDYRYDSSSFSSSFYGD